MASAFHLHDLNRDNILEAEEILKLYGVDHETALDQSDSVKHHDSKAERILKEVMDRLDVNRDGIITKTEFVSVADKEGLPKFDDIPGLGHHYDEEGEYFLQLVLISPCPSSLGLTLLLSLSWRKAKMGLFFFGSQVMKKFIIHHLKLKPKNLIDIQKIWHISHIMKKLKLKKMNWIE